MSLLKKHSRATRYGTAEAVRKQDIKLTDYGVTFERYKQELSQGISNGYRPHFGYNLIDFNNLKEGFRALNYEDETGEADPIMSVVNSDSIEKFQHLLLSSNKAKMNGTTMVIEKDPQRMFDRHWLYAFV